MASYMNAFIITLSLLFVSIPFWNKFVFHTINIDQIIIEGREGLGKVQELQGAGKFPESRDSAQVLIYKFRNDSSEIFASDIVDWAAALKLLDSTSNSFGSQLLTKRLNENDLGLLRSYTVADLTPLVKKQIVALFNNAKADPMLYVNNTGRFAVHSDPRTANYYKKLVGKGILIENGSSVSLKPNMNYQERRALQKLHVMILDKFIYPGIVKKDYRQGFDWASEFIVQTAMHFIGASYSDQFQPDAAIQILDSLILLYPKSIYAEVVFEENGQTLLKDGKNQLSNGQTSMANMEFHKAIYYLEKIERNRDIARQFPKYKYVDLKPDEYVNVDVASRAKRKVRAETQLYTAQKAKEDLSGKKSDEKSGYYLEDAVRLIGECYLQLGLTDSARSQFRLILQYFPESDNLSNAQKLIADSYVKDGDLLLARGDSANVATRQKADAFYLLAIKEYQRFVNVYPQSDLISETYISMGDAYNKMKRPADAAKSFAAALSRAKETEAQAKVQLKIGNYYFERKRYPEAIAAYQVILSNFLSTEVASNAQYLQGECYENSGDSVKALEAYAVIVDHYKQSTFFGSSALKIGDWNFNRKNYKTALEVYKTGRAYVDPNSDQSERMQFQIGMIWRKIGDDAKGEDQANDYREALKQFKSVIDNFRETRYADQAGYQTAEIEKTLGNEKAAREAVKNISSRDILLKTLTLFRGEQGDNPEEDLKFWDQAYKDAVENEERAQALYEKGNVLLEKTKKYDEALTSYQQALSVTSDNQKKINCQVGIARVYNAQLKFKDAQDVISELLKNKNVSTELRQQLQIQLYDAYYRAKEYEKALDGFESFAAQFPSHALASYAIFRIGSIYADQQKYDKAMEKFRIIEDKYAASKEYDRAILMIGTQMVALGKAQDAVAYLEKFMKGHKDTPAAASIYLKIGDIYSKEFKNNAKALSYLALVCDSFPQDPQFSYGAYRYGMVLKEENKEQQAKAAFEKVRVEDIAIYRAAQAEIGKIIAKTDPEGAIKSYMKIVEKCETPEDSAIALMGIGDVYSTIQKWPEAAKAFQKVYDSYKGQDTNIVAGAIVKWADALNNSKDYKDVIRVAQIMQKAYPNNVYTVNTMYYEAMAYFASQELTNAERCFDKIINSGKSEQLTEIAYYQKGDCQYFKKGGSQDAQMKSAIREYDAYLKKYPAGKYSARALYMEGNAYVTLENFSEAKQRLEKVVEKYPDFEEFCFAKNFYAFSLNKLEQWRAASKLYNEVIKGKCNSKAVEFARQQLESIKTAH
jgi:tetratricopeptide (TPR) repeat protein